MTNLSRDLDPGMKAIESACWGFFAICAVIETRWLLLRAVHTLSWGEPDWAAWVQAVGSVAAILIAVWISQDQHAKQIERDQSTAADDVQAMLKILRVEIEVLFENSERNIGEDLDNSPAGTPFLFIFPVPENPFTIFDAIAPKLGTVTDEKLRKQIIRAYGVGKSYVSTFRYHNEIVMEYRQLARGAERNPAGPEANLLPRESDRLAQYSDLLRATHVALRTEVAGLLNALPT